MSIKVHDEYEHDTYMIHSLCNSCTDVGKALSKLESRYAIEQRPDARFTIENQMVDQLVILLNHIEPLKKTRIEMLGKILSKYGGVDD